MKYCWLFAFICHVAFCQFYKKDIAILYDDPSLLISHSIVLNHLREYASVGFDLIKLTESAELVQFDNIKYNHVCIFTNRKEKWLVTVPEILKFVDAGGNILLIIGAGAGSEASSLINELGFIDRNDYYFFDNSDFTYSEDTEEPYHKAIVINATQYLIKSKAIFDRSFSSIKYNGRGFAFDRTNPFTFPILTGSETSFLAFANSSIRKAPLALGTRIVLVGGVEMRNLARGVIIGSYHAFEDKSLFDSFSLQTENLDFFISLCKWAFQKKGVLRIINPDHHLVSSGKALDEYIVETEIEYSIKVEELDQDGKWKPFYTDDLQLELIRLTTFGRVTYNATKDGVYTARLYTPDFIGTYGLRTYYHNVGYTTLDHEIKIVIRPRRHIDYERFIFGAYPYYITSFSMMILVFVLVFVLLNIKTPKEKLS